MCRYLKLHTNICLNVGIITITQLIVAASEGSTNEWNRKDLNMTGTDLILLNV